MSSASRGLNEAMLNALGRVAPGTPLRDGIDRVVRANAGALLVLSDDADVLSICSGGFLVDAPYSPQRLSELAKMDGAIIISTDGGRIARANVHLVPDPTVPTSETGTRHRTAERVARSLRVPVISASEEMGVINVYAGGSKRQLQEIAPLLERGNQALQTLDRYVTRLDDSIATLTDNEINDNVTLRDVALVVQRGELVHRIADEIETMIVELGVDARLLRLQLDELYGEVDDELDLVIADYCPEDRGPSDVLAAMTALTDDEVHDLRPAAASLQRADIGEDLDHEIAPRGMRLLARAARLEPDTANAIVSSFGDMAALQDATIADILAIDGVDQTTATNVYDTIEHLTKSTVVDQYD